MRLRDFFKRKNKQTPDGVTIQTRTGYQHPFNAINQYVPLRVEYELYKTMREAVPVLDTAVSRIVRLVGKFDIECDNDRQQQEIRDFLENVKVNSNQKGIYAFAASYLDQLIECGNSAGEIVLNNRRNDLYALKNVDISSIRLRQTENPLENSISQIQPGHYEPKVLPYQDLILFTPLNPKGDSPYGVSLFRSMPFVTGVLLKIFNSMGTNWERFGNVRYSVIYKPQDDKEDINKIKERVKLIEACRGLSAI
ncbi:hypothetical protein HNQ80_004142 [Anaerosolibacter carboniphilus]|uniref:Uncharacterized protein n=1 Tax=Anaerosolibacter carboniphilus TaxID=1417629 RepID=A0A841L6V5_9FIRM|nr:hypothetical protein [Anaerosolibacter carboniphilus]MBB6218005.1 hypothetical protein [Anaerosolibacter carboniphilus]